MKVVADQIRQSTDMAAPLVIKSDLVPAITSIPNGPLDYPQVISAHLLIPYRIEPETRLPTRALMPQVARLTSSLALSSNANCIH
jgi:hypothetical protein